jgi:hypothetical protein
MQPPSIGELVKVADGGRPVDGIVFDLPSRTKVVVAVVDPAKGPVFRTVNPNTLSERSQEGPDDRALQLLIRRTPTSPRGAGGGGPAARREQAGHTRAAMHRTTGK